MNIDYELKLKNDIKIGWKSNKKDVLRICKENNIDYISKTYGSIFKISLPIEFANLINRKETEKWQIMTTRVMLTHKYWQD